MRTGYLTLTLLPAILVACASQTPDPDAGRPKVIALSRIEDLDGCSGSGNDFAKLLGHALAERKQALVVGHSDTSELRPKHPRGQRPPQGGAPGGEGGMGGHHGGSKGMHAQESGENTPRPMRYRLLGSLAWETDSVGTRSLNRLDTAGKNSLRTPLAQLRLVDESTGRAVWKQSVRIDSLAPVSGNCPQAPDLSRLATEAAKAAATGLGLH